MSKLILDEDQKGILEEINNGENLLVAFGGIDGRLAMPVFEFYNSIKDVRCDKVFIRDLFQAWYQFGCDSRYDSIEKLRLYLNGITKNYKRVCFCGNSMGGYASIFFGTALDVDYIIAFSPQSFIDKFRRTIYFDRRCRKQIAKVHTSKMRIKHSNLDLKKYLKDTSYNSSIDIYYDSKVRIDKIHSERLRDYKNVVLVKNTGGHGVVKKLRDDGLLVNIFQSKLS